LGQIGDFFGGVLNPTLSFLGLVAILLTLHVQGKELKTSINEIKITQQINLDAIKIQKQTAEMNALVALIEFKKESAKENANLANYLSTKVKENPNREKSPLDDLVFNTFRWDKHDKDIYQIRLESLLAEISGKPKPTAKERTELANEIEKWSSENTSQSKNTNINNAE
jgi:hypothetical protein